MCGLKLRRITNKKNNIEEYDFNQFELDIETNDDLWSVPIPEFLSFNYMGSILHIFDVKNTSLLPYDVIKQIIEENNYPIYNGLVMSGINILEAQYAIKKIRKGKTLYIERI